MIKELKELASQLTNPKFLHVLLEPLLLWGVLIGVVAWMISLWILGNRKAQVCSLLLLAVSSFAVLPLLHYRKKAEPFWPSSKALADKQSERRQDTQWVYWVMGGLAVAGFFLTGEGKGKLGTVTGLAIAGGGVAITVFSLWLHGQEIELFHPDAKPVPVKRAALPPSGSRLTWTA